MKITKAERQAAQEVADFVNQTILPDLPPRQIPTGKLEPKRKQTDKPTLLELFQDEIKQRKLFAERE